MAEKDNSNQLNLLRTQQVLEDCLDSLCRLTRRDIYVILPEAKEERNAYLIKEIKKTLELIK